MNKEKIILTDADSVLVDWNKAFKEFMTEKGYISTPNCEKHYRLCEWYPSFNDQEIRELVLELNTSNRIAKLEAFRDATEYVAKLNKIGYTFICITALSQHPAARKYREENIDNLFGKGTFDHSRMICLNPNDSKYDSLKQWEDSGLYWIEDHFGHAESGYELGLKSILMANEYNKQFHTNLFPTVNSWKEIYEIINPTVNTIQCDTFCTLED